MMALAPRNDKNQQNDKMRAPATTFRLKGPDDRLAYTVHVRPPLPGEKGGALKGKRAMTVELFRVRGRKPVAFAVVAVQLGEAVPAAVTRGLIAMRDHADGRTALRLAQSHRQIGAWLRRELPAGASRFEPSAISVQPAPTAPLPGHGVRRRSPRETVPPPQPLPTPERRQRGNKMGGGRRKSDDTLKKVLGLLTEALRLLTEELS